MPHPQITYTTPTVDRHGDHTHIAFEMIDGAGIGREVLTLARFADLGGAIVIRGNTTHRRGFVVIPDPILATVLAEIRHLRGDTDQAPGGCELAAAGCPCGGAVDHSKASE